jgi:hypothetical protein
MKKLIYTAVFVCFFLSGCASLNDSLTPSMSVITDDFDGSTIVRQPPVSAASSMSEAWHTFGFEWVSSSPDVVFITAGANGIVNIEDVEFNVDGELVSDIEPASSTTEYGDWSTRRFAMSWEDFSRIVRAQSIKMKVVKINEYSVSSFGPENGGATVDTKFSPFVVKVTELRGD